MAEAAIRQQIYTILSAVSGVGKVYDYERWTADWETFITLFKDTASGHILGWEISRAGVNAENLSCREENSDHTYVIRGYMSVKDAESSEKSFNLLIEAIRTAFRSNHSLNGTALDAGPISVPVIESRLFGSVLCHYSELRLPVSEILS